MTRSHDVLAKGLHVCDLDDLKINSWQEQVIALRPHGQELKSDIVRN